jgi:hypothetical protein
MDSFSNTFYVIGRHSLALHCDDVFHSLNRTYEERVTLITELHTQAIGANKHRMAFPFANRTIPWDQFFVIPSQNPFI